MAAVQLGLVGGARGLMLAATATAAAVAALRHEPTGQEDDDLGNDEHWFQLRRQGSGTPTSSTPQTTAPSAGRLHPKHDDGSDDDTTTSVGKISHNQMKRLLQRDGADMYKKIKRKAAADFSKGSNRTVWDNANYRVDFEHFDTVNGIRHWTLQVNKETRVEAARRLLRGGRTTHTKVFEGDFNARDPPSLDGWKRSILDKLKK